MQQAIVMTANSTCVRTAQSQFITRVHEGGMYLTHKKSLHKDTALPNKYKPK